MMLGQLAEYDGHELSRNSPTRTLFLEEVTQPHVLEAVECTDILTTVITDGMEWTRRHIRRGMRCDKGKLLLVASTGRAM